MMKYLKKKLQRFFVRIFLGDSYCRFNRNQAKKIYPSPCPVEPIDDAQDSSGLELLLEPNPEKEFTYQDLQMLTNNFSRENLFSHTHFGKLYLGRIPDGWKGMEAQDVTVKMWKQDTGYIGVNWETLVRLARPNDALNRMASEINFLSQPEMESHPNMATIMGYCFEENKLGVVYSIKPRNTIRKFANYGTFTWACRIKVALELARLLEFLHGHQPQFLVRNLAAAHIMLNKDWNPVLIDCSMLVGGGFGDTRKAGEGGPNGSVGYLDPYVCNSGEWTDKSDVFAFGVILLELIFKCRVDGFKKCKGYKLDLLGPMIYQYAQECGEINFSFANKVRFGKDRTFIDSGGDEDGPIISKLAVRCLEEYPGSRPTMAEIIGELEKLQVCKEWKGGVTDGAAMLQWVRNGQK